MRDFETRENVLLIWGDVRALNNLAFGSVDLNNTSSSQLASDLRLCIADAVFRYPHQKKCQPTKENMGPDPVGNPVVHRTPIKRRLESAEGVFDLKKLLVAQGRVGPG